MCQEDPIRGVQADFFEVTHPEAVLLGNDLARPVSAGERLTEAADGAI